MELPRSRGRTSTCSSSTSRPGIVVHPSAGTRRDARPRPARARRRGRGGRRPAGNRAPARPRHVGPARRRPLARRRTARCRSRPAARGRAALPRARPRPPALAHRPDRGADRPRPQRPDAPLARHGQPARRGHAGSSCASACPTHALLEVRLETGRTHQIRVHLEAIGLPVGGDPVYGVARRPRPRAAVPPRAPAAFAHPFTGERGRRSSRRCRPTWRPRWSARGQTLSEQPRCSRVPRLWRAATTSGVPTSHDPATSARAAVPRPCARFRPGPPAAVPSTNQKGADRGKRLHARAAGGRRALRPPDAPLEPEDDALHLHRARRHLHHRPPADARSCSRRPTTSRATSPSAAARSCSSARRSRRRTPSPSRPRASACRTSTSAGSAAC